LLAAVVMHHLTGEGDFDRLMGSGPWPAGEVKIDEFHALIVGFLLIIAAAGKSALVPFSGWLPRAMEGPTPSSAVFYGALSVHLGAFLLLRLEPLLESSPILAWTVVALGLTTAVYAAIVGSAQTDIKSALSFASLSQVGLIVAEIGLGFRWIPLIHMLGHACLRTLQFVRAPTFLKDQRAWEDAAGSRLRRPATIWGRLIPGPMRAWLYRFAIERGSLDAMLNDWIVSPFVRLFRWFDRLEKRWTRFLSGKKQAETPVEIQAKKTTTERVEELL